LGRPPLVGLSVISSPRGGRHGVRRPDRAGSIKGSVAPPAVGGSDPPATSRPVGPTIMLRWRCGGRGCARRAGRSRPGSAVCGDGDLADVAPAAGGDLLAGRDQPPGRRWQLLHGFDRGPADQGGALFICGTRDVNPAGVVVLDLLRRRLGPSGWGLGSRLGRSPTAQRPQGLDADTWPDASSSTLRRRSLSG